MKKILIITFCVAAYAAANAQITVPRPSPEGSTYSKVGLTDITIDYFIRFFRIIKLYKFIKSN